MTDTPRHTGDARPIDLADEELDRWVAELDSLLFNDPDFAAAVGAATDVAMQSLVDVGALARRWRIKDPVVRRELKRCATRRSTSFSQEKRAALLPALFLLAEAPTSHAAGRLARYLVLTPLTRAALEREIIRRTMRWYERSVIAYAEADLRQEAPEAERRPAIVISEALVAALDEHPDESLNLGTEDEANATVRPDLATHLGRLSPSQRAFAQNVLERPDLTNAERDTALGRETGYSRKMWSRLKQRRAG